MQSKRLLCANTQITQYADAKQENQKEKQEMSNTKFCINAMLCEFGSEALVQVALAFNRLSNSLVTIAVKNYMRNHNVNEHDERKYSR